MSRGWHFFILKKNVICDILIIQYEIFGGKIMNIVSNEQIYAQKNKIQEAQKNKKNLMYYDMQIEKCSDIDENIIYRYFYSSPYDSLEFITLDVFNYAYAMKHKIFGVLTIIRDRVNIPESECGLPYGEVEIEDIIVREVEKSRIKLFINSAGIQNIDLCINYFENKYCIK
jgi:hypothetical protein